VSDTTERVVATFDDDRIEEARQAAAACPTDAIVVEEVDG
jgi:ferredoxin